jgi:ABC-type branched-subunit amino acid transport system substrate-binding protein
MRNPIYDQHDKAFARVSAFVIMKGGERAATVAFKFPADGAGRLQCFFHVISLPMVKGTASGYGYDKKSAAFADAARKAEGVKLENWQEETGYLLQRAIATAINQAMQGNDGRDWNDNLRDAGFTVFQAV